MPESRQAALDQLVEFARVLRQEGLTVGAGQMVAYCRAVARLGPWDLSDLYWAGRSCLVTRRTDLESYDRAFHDYFLGGTQSHGPNPRTPPRREQATDDASMDDVATSRAEVEEGDGPMGIASSDAEVLRERRFSECSPDELAALRRLMAGLRIAPPSRRTRRTRPARRGEYPDLRHTVRRALRTQGEIVHPARRQKRSKPRRLVLILDISGSMANYSRALLQFAHSATRAVPAIEVFCFGTRLTRITDAFRQRNDPDAALQEAARSVVDWEGGTRIGDSIRGLTDSPSGRGAVRAAVVVICSDGLERGDPTRLAAEMARLARLAHRIVWVNPLKGDPGYEPLARGMGAALPHVDVFVPGHNLASLEGLATLIPTLG